MQAHSPHSRYVTPAYLAARASIELRRGTAAGTSKTQSKTDGRCTFDPARRSCLGHGRFKKCESTTDIFPRLSSSNFGKLNDCCNVEEKKRVVRPQATDAGLDSPPRLKAEVRAGAKMQTWANREDLHTAKPLQK